MRNLKNFHRRVLRSPNGLRLTASTWDVATDSVICAFGPTKEDVLIRVKRWNQGSGSSPQLLDTLQQIASWDAPCPLPDLDCDSILDLHYFSESSTACIVLVGGDIVVVRELPQHGEERIEIVGSVDAGISAAAWSPDEELLAITTRADTLLYMTRDFENVTDITFTSDDLKASKHVSVGWGKSETQFKGKRAKVLRDPTMPEIVEEGNLSRYDKETSTISWRGDGAYVAVNSIEAESRRVIRVYSREGVLESVSEPVNGLEGAVSWRPSGNLLASIQRLEDRIDVVFFEKNGLRHGQFDLKLTREDMEKWGSTIQLRWNVDSSVLAVCFDDRAQLWTMGNYHYYLKTEIPLLSKILRGQPASFVWHPEVPLRSLIHDGDGLQRLDFHLHIASGSTSPPNDYGIIGVIDGKKLKLTPLRLANVPPPMALHDITLASNIIDVAMSNDITDGKSNRIAVMDHENIAIYHWNLKAKPNKPPVLLISGKLSHLPDFTSRDEYPDAIPQQITWFDQDHILVLQSRMVGSMILLFRICSSSLSLVHTIDIALTQSILTVQEKTTPRVYRHSSDGYILEERVLLHSTHDQALDVVVDALARFSKNVSDVKLIHTMARTPTGSVGTIAFGLSDSGSLFANERRLARDCTSFLLTPAHLIFTTTQHLLKFVHMASVGDLEVPPDTPETDERCRSIERGAKLVTVMPSIFALVLQMPRGNLETIYPRALVLAGIRQNLNNKKYRTAFLACRNHRVDMNILHDHSPQDLIANVGLFIDQVGKVEHIDLFLSQLREEDVSNTMYRETLSPSIFSEDTVQQNSLVAMTQATDCSKVNSVCDAFLSILQTRKATNLQNVITAHVCKIPPDLEAALLEIAKLQNAQSDQADRAVEHICFLADVNKLYDNALGLYDLDLALLVAQQSQKDPREYLPFLQSLQEMPTYRKQYTINDFLRRHRKALKDIYNLSVFEEFKSYTIKHILYEDALQCCRYNEDEIDSIMRVYAEYLQKELRYKEAGIAFEYLHEYTLASEAYRLAQLWKESLSCATSIPLPEPQLHSLARTLADALIEVKDFQSAATIHLDYLADIETGARLFCKGYLFADASRVLGLHQRTDLVESVIDTGLVEGMGAMTELLAECKAQLNAQVPRLRELRVKKAEEPLAFFDGDVNGGADIPDNVSLAPTDASTSGGSLFTRYTNRTGTVGTNATRRTSKNRRREERKRARGKKGSVYEEEYLVNSIGRLIDRVNAVGDEMGRLVVGLMRRGMRERAKAVEGAMIEVVALCKACVGEVFQNDSKDSNAAAKENEATDRPKGGDGVLWDSMEEVQARREVPLVKDFEKLSLIVGQ